MQAQGLLYQDYYTKDYYDIVVLRLAIKHELEVDVMAENELMSEFTLQMSTVQS